jgi:membrane-associated phospholipid phosphatase
MTIILTLLFRLHKNLFKILLPFSVVLLFSTIYIKAHYFVDIVSGLVSAPFVLLLNKFIYNQLKPYPKTTNHGN